MRSLKLTLMVVEYLKRNLSAEIVLQEEKKHWEKEKGHWEDDGYYIVGGGISVDKSYEAINERYVIDEPGEWVIDKPRIAEPDVEKRKKAKVELQQICESSKWYSARYIAGKAIIINANILKIQVYDWVLELVKRRKGTITVIRKFKVGGHYENRPVKMPSKNALRAHQDLVEMYKILPFRKYRFGISKLLSKSRDEFLADEVLRGTKVNEFELKTVYSSRAVSEKARLAAARKLGYSSFKMWKDQHPFQSVFLIIFSVVLYLLVLCFSIIRIINSLLIYGW